MKKLLIVLAVLAFLISPSIARAQAGHEYSPLTEQTVNYKNWTLTNLVTEKEDDLRKAIHRRGLNLVYAVDGRDGFFDAVDDFSFDHVR